MLYGNDTAALEMSQPCKEREERGKYVPGRDMEEENSLALFAKQEEGRVWELGESLKITLDRQGGVKGPNWTYKELGI